MTTPIQDKAHCCGEGNPQKLEGSCISSGNDTNEQSDPCCISPPQFNMEESFPSPEGTNKIRYRIDKMDCPTEEYLIRQKLESMKGVERLNFNLM